MTATGPMKWWERLVLLLAEPAIYLVGKYHDRSRQR